MELIENFTYSPPCQLEPTEYTGRLPFDRDVDPAMLPGHIADSLRDICRRRIEVDKNRIRFSGGILGPRPKWDILFAFDSGEITIDLDARQVRYCLNFRELAVASSLLVVFSFGFSYAVHSLVALLAAVIWWAWLVGTSLFVGIIAFKKCVHKAIESTPRVM